MMMQIPALKKVCYVLFGAFLGSILGVPQLAHAADVSIEITSGAAAKQTGAFAPDAVQVQVRDSVIWTNADTVIHTVTSGNPSEGANGLFGGTDESPELIAPRRSQSFSFAQAGEFSYYCVLHPIMTGSISVVDKPVYPMDSSVPISVNDSQYVISAKSDTTKIISASIQSEHNSLTFDKSGRVELALPKPVFANVTGVMADDKLLDYQLVGEDELTTRVSFEIPADNMEVVIVPEFPAVMIMLVLTFGSLVIVSRQFR